MLIRKTIKPKTKKQLLNKTKKISKKVNSYSGVCTLIPLHKINNQYLKQLSSITQDQDVMKYIGKGNKWTTTELKQFIKDEAIESKKPTIKRQYYSYVMVCNGETVGFIAGRKNKNLLPRNSSPYDLLLRMFISRLHSGKGFGKLIIKLFIAEYSRILKNTHINKSKSKSNDKFASKAIKLISDIDKDNISSIKIHQANNFIYTDTITYPNHHNYERYILELNL